MQLLRESTEASTSLKEGSTADSLKEGSIDSLKEGSIDSLKEGSINSLKEGSIDSLKEDSISSLKELSTDSDSAFKVQLLKEVLVSGLDVMKSTVLKKAIQHIDVDD